LLVDLDGVLYVGEQPLPGAIDVVAELRAAGLGLRFVTNTTARSRRATLEKLIGFGIELEEEELITPAVLARRRCEERGHRRLGLIMDAAVKEDFAGLEEVDEAPDAVIMGDLGSDFGFEILNAAFRMVFGGADLIALQKNRFWRTADGLSLDAGPFVAAIEYATGTTAEVVGKPSRAFFALVLDSLGAGPGEAAMIGDDVESDIGGALDSGLRAILVRTGKYEERFVAESGIAPTATLDSIADAPRALGLG
jgi:HAD superfamily hydrolase (TIGR01458 family)